MNLGNNEKDAKMRAQQKAFQCKYKECWLGKYKSLYVFKHRDKPESKNLVLTLKWNGKGLDIYDEKGKQINTITGKTSSTLDVPNTAVKKTSKPSKQSE